MVSRKERKKEQSSHLLLQNRRRGKQLFSISHTYSHLSPSVQLFSLKVNYYYAQNDRQITACVSHPIYRIVENKMIVRHLVLRNTNIDR